MVFSLHHYIIRSKRFADARTLYQAAGILAYCNSFLKICERSLDDDIEKIPRFNEEALIQSLNARASEETYKASQRGGEAILRTTRLAFGVAIIAVAIAILVMLVQPQIEKGELEALKKLSAIAGRYFVSIPVGLVLLFVAFWILDRGFRSVPTISVWKDILEAANVKRKKAIVVFVTLSATVLFASVWLGFPAVRDFWRSLIFLFAALV